MRMVRAWGAAVTAGEGSAHPNGWGGRLGREGGARVSAGVQIPASTHIYPHIYPHKSTFTCICVIIRAYICIYVYICAYIMCRCAGSGWCGGRQPFAPSVPAVPLWIYLTRVWLSAARSGRADKQQQYQSCPCTKAFRGFLIKLQRLSPGNEPAVGLPEPWLKGKCTKGTSGFGSWPAGSYAFGASPCLPRKLFPEAAVAAVMRCGPIKVGAVGVRPVVVRPVVMGSLDIFWAAYRLVVPSPFCLGFSFCIV